MDELPNKRVSCMSTGGRIFPGSFHLLSMHGLQMQHSKQTCCLYQDNHLCGMYSVRDVYFNENLQFPASFCALHSEGFSTKCPSIIEPVHGNCHRPDTAIFGWPLLVLPVIYSFIGKFLFGLFVLLQGKNGYRELCLGLMKLCMMWRK